MIPIVKIAFAGYPSWADASITARTFITFVMLSNRRNSTTRAVMIRPVQSLPFETGPACVSDCTIRSSLVAQGARAPTLQRFKDAPETLRLLALSVLCLF